MRAGPVDDAPTLSGPNHVSILTGVRAARHGVRDNAAPALAAVRQPDYFEILERRDPSLTTLKLVAWPPDELVPSGADAVVVAPDEELASRAVRAIAGGTDVLFVFLDGPDAAGHAAGFGSDDYLRAVAAADAIVGRLLDAIGARPSIADEDWQVVLATDHGGSGRSHGGTTPAETTIPFVVTSRHAAAAAADGVRNADVAPTVLAHFGIDPRTPIELRPGGPAAPLDGVPRVPVTPR
jgi:predicted AlkP superfamily pyrophosphatase or phosphodiesterase